MLKRKIELNVLTSNLRQPHLRRHLMAGIVCALAILLFFFARYSQQQEQRTLMMSALQTFNQHVINWLGGEQRRLEPMVNDPRLQGTIADGLNARSRQALYSFRFTQTVQDIYIYDTRAGQLMRAPDTIPLPTHILNALRDEQPAEFRAFLVDINNTPFLLTSVPLNYPEPRPKVYVLAAQPINASIKSLLQLQPALQGYQLSLMFKQPTHKLLPHIHSGSPRFINAPEALYVTAGAVYNKLELNALTGLTLAAALADINGWQTAITSQESTASLLGVLMPIVIMLILALTLIYARDHLFFATRYLRRRNKRQAAAQIEVGAGQYSSFTAPINERITQYGGTDSPAQAIPTPERLLASLRPTGHLKTWNEVQDSFKQDRTVLVYQPIVDINTEQPVMYEVYLRVLKKDNSHMLPGKFLPAMEHYHAAGKLDTHVLEKLINEHFSQDTPPTHAFTINLTSQAFDAASFMTAMMEKLPTAALQHLGFELRHHEIRKDGAAKQFMNECLDMGLPLSVDYFGGGKTMLEIAKKIGFSYVKVTKQTLDEEGFSLEQLAEHGRELNLKIVLERIETKAEYNQARAAGIPYVQGYYISKPLPWDEIVK